jgi:two-component system cell cycle sensor histidine kinase/response regulator CckA
MIQLVTRSTPVTLAYAGGLVVLGLIAFAAARRRPSPVAEADGGVPDWSVTVAAIEQPGLAIAITDRASRLVCANAAYELWFGSSHAPPRMPVDGASAEQLARAARWAASNVALPDDAALERYMRAAAARTSSLAERGAPDGSGARRVAASYLRPFQAHASIGPSCAVAIDRA